MTDLASLLGDEADSLLAHESKGIPAADLHLPGPDYISRVLEQSDRSPQVLRSLQSLFDHGRLGGSGYVSILPVDQGIEHSGAASFAPNPKYFDPSNICELAVEGGCNGVASTFGVLGAFSFAAARNAQSEFPIRRNVTNFFERRRFLSINRLRRNKQQTHKAP